PVDPVAAARGEAVARDVQTWGEPVPVRRGQERLARPAQLTLRRAAQGRADGEGPRGAGEVRRQLGPRAGGVGAVRPDVPMADAVRRGNEAGGNEGPDRRRRRTGRRAPHGDGGGEIRRGAGGDGEEV